MTPEEPQEVVTRQEYTVLQEAHAEGVTHDAHTVSQLPSETVQDLLRMLTWWKEYGKGIDMQAATQAKERPTFRRDTTDTKTIRLSTALIRDAERYAKRHKWTRGTFNGLVEVLLWRCLGSLDKHIIPEQSEGEE